MTPADVLSADRYIAEIDAAARRMTEVLAGVDLDAHVGTCPAWVVRDLVVHQGGIHRWATRIVAEKRTERAFMNLDELGGPPDDADLFRWFTDGAAALTNALADAADDLECFTFVAAPTAKLHWARRQAHETAIHRIDAEVVAGARTGFEPDFAADGIDELVMAFWLRPGRGPRSAVTTSLAINPDDVSVGWTTTFDADGVESVRSVEAAQAEVGGGASDLYAWAWGRPPVGQVTVHGDGTAVARFFGDG